MDKRPHYRQSGIVFSLIAAMFALLALHIATDAGWLMYLVGALAIAVVIYAIVSSVRFETKSKK